MTIKAVQMNSFGPASEVAYCAELPDPTSPEPDEIIVDIAAFPINPADLLTIEGKYAAKPPLPYTPGAEAVGHVSDVGSAVENFRIGDLVMLLSRENWTQKRKVKAAELLKIDTESENLFQLAMLKVNPATAALMLRNYVELKPGDWIIQDAANSGVGHCVIRLAAKSGVKTINVVRRENLIAPLQGIGADVVLAGSDNLAGRVNQITGGDGVRLAIDAVAGQTSLELASCLADGGVMINYGMLSGEPCMVMPDWIVFRHLTLTGFWLATQLRDMPREQIESLYKELINDISQGVLDVPIAATYNIDDIKDALEHAGRENRSGKVLVLPNDAA
ncbi:MAG: zinc-dependent alcohol dehydrogenase family protein [Pseudomonadota bacterium]|nr:zinc-dependent alcohol dehydrogenase family protein [Pseudomonadota bacterium]